MRVMFCWQVRTRDAGGDQAGNCIRYLTTVGNDDETDCVFCVEVKCWPRLHRLHLPPLTGQSYSVGLCGMRIWHILYLGWGEECDMCHQCGSGKCSPTIVAIDEVTCDDCG